MAAASALALVSEAHFFEESMDPGQVRRFLEDPSGRDLLKGMKWLLAMISKGRNVSDFFPAVVKNVIAKSVEVKKMVYIYLVHYADHSAACRELALLSINSFQKDLAASNQLIRALALRVMTSIRVPDIIQIQLLAVRKCAGDGNPYVRKCAALALPKIHKLGPDHLPALKGLISQLLRDASTMVLGSAVAAFTVVCPEDLALLHPCYRKLCHVLADCDEWSQILLLKTMTRYLRVNFCDPSPGKETERLRQAEEYANAPLHTLLNEQSSSGNGVPSVAAEDAENAQAGVKGVAKAALPPHPKRTIKRRVVKKAFYSDEEDESEEEEVEVHESAPAHTTLSSSLADGQSLLTSDLDPDHRLALRSALPLLKSRNAGIVLGVASLFASCAPHFGSGTADVNAKKIAKALVRNLRSHREIQFVMLTAIRDLAKIEPSIFVDHMRDFYVKAGDPTFSRVLKLEILTLISTPANVQELLRELGSYIRQGDTPLRVSQSASAVSSAAGAGSAFVVAAVKAVGRIAEKEPEYSDRCVAGLITLLRASRSDSVIEAAAGTIRIILTQNRSWSGLGEAVQLVASMLVEGLEAQAKGEAVPDALQWTANAGARASITALAAETEDLLTSGASSAAASESPNAKDVLRLLAKLFADEGPVVKTQALVLASKLSLRFPDDDRVQKLATYVLELGRYDVDYDIRDRARFLASLMGFAPAGQEDVDESALVGLSFHSKAVLLNQACSPSMFIGLKSLPGQSEWDVGSLSSVVGHKVDGYEALPDWPDIQPDTTVRDLDEAPTKLATEIGPDNFYDDDEDESTEESDSGDSEDDDEEDDDDDDDEEDFSSEVGPLSRSIG